MRIFEEFAEWFNKSDEHIVEYHLKKDKENLKKTLRELEDELDEMNKIRNRVEFLLEGSEKILGEKTSTAKIKTAKQEDYHTWLKEVEKKLNKIFDSDENKLTAHDVEEVKNELPRLKAEKNRLNNRIKKLLEIIAKTKYLINDLNEDLCQQLSNGHSLAEVGQTLADKFSNELKEDYFSGKDDVCQFLQTHYKIKKKQACELFDLLEEMAIIRFKIDVSEDQLQQPMLYYGTDWDDPMMEYVTIPPALMGHWEINS